MNNLFVLHTQYNLILAIGLCKTELKNDTNDLILFEDFKITERYKEVFDRNFINVHVINGNYHKGKLTPTQKYNKIKNDISTITSQISEKYDSIFIVDDMCIQEMFCLKLVGTKNKYAKMFWLEDGSNAYFDNGVPSLGMGGTVMKRFIRKFIFSTRFRLGKYYDLGPCMGSNRNLSGGWFTFPEAVRPELKQIDHYLITDKAFKFGMKELFYGNKIDMLDDSILIALDLLAVYGEDFLSVIAYVEEIAFEAQKNGQTVYYKYHPRETGRMDALNKCVELDRTVALESYLINTTANKLTIVGFKSTALQTARKIGYETISYIKKLEPDSTDISNFYESIGIICK